MMAFLPDPDLGVRREGKDGHRHVLRRGPFADTAGRVVLRTMAWAEPAAIFALLTERDAPEMGTDAHHDQPVFLALAGRAIGVSRLRVAGQIGVAGERILEIVERHLLRRIYLFGGAVPDEDRLAAPLHGERLAGLQ